MDLPVYLPLPDAARKFNISLKMLTRLVQDGKIEAVQLSSGEVAVSEQSLKTKEQIIAEKYAYLVGQAITISEATRKYKVPDGTLRVWINRGYVHTVNRDSYPMQIDEAETAYCAQIYHERRARGTHSGAPLLDEAGRPYELKRPELADYRRRKKQAT